MTLISNQVMTKPVQVNTNLNIKETQSPKEAVKVCDNQNTTNDGNLITQQVSLEYQVRSLDDASEIVDGIHDLFYGFASFDGLTDEELFALEEKEYKEFRLELEHFVSKEDLEGLDSFRKSAIEYEKKGDFDSADKEWDKFDTILMKYDEIGLPDDYEDFDIKELDLEEEDKEYFDAMLRNGILSLGYQLELFKTLSKDDQKTSEELTSLLDKLKTISERKDLSSEYEQIQKIVYDVGLKLEELYDSVYEKQDEIETKLHGELDFKNYSNNLFDNYV